MDLKEREEQMTPEWRDVETDGERESMRDRQTDRQTDRQIEIQILGHLLWESSYWVVHLDKYL